MNAVCLKIKSESNFLLTISVSSVSLGDFHVQHVGSVEMIQKIILNR